ncbi:MAG: phage portal protein [Planctomycetota bacterium]
MTSDRDWLAENGFAEGDEALLSGKRLTHRRALGHSPVWRGVNLIATTIAKVKVYPYVNRSEDVREKDRKHPAYRLLARKINPFITSFSWKEMIAFHAVMFGNGYALIVRAAGKPKQLIPLSPFDTFPVQKNGELWYITTVGGERRKIPAADIFHLKGLSFDGLVGLCVYELLADTLDLGISARDFALQFFKQGMNASGILMIPGHLKPDAIKAAIRDFDQIATGVTRAHRVGLLQDGVKWQPTTVDAEKSQMNEARKLDVREVANVLGLPGYLLGDDSRTSHNSLESESQSFLDFSIDSHFCRFEEEASLKLLTEEEQDTESHVIEFNRKALLRMDAKTRYEIYGITRQWGIDSANDCRLRENQPGIGPKGDVYLSPTNMQDAQKLIDPPPAPAPVVPPPVVPDPEPPPQDDPPADDQAARNARILGQCRNALEERATRIDEIAVKRLRQIATKPNAGELALEVLADTSAKYREAVLPLLQIADAVDGRQRQAGIAAQVKAWETGVRATLGADVETVVTKLPAVRKTAFETFFI